MSETPSAPRTVDIPQEARDRARELGWDDGLIELALKQGHTLQEVWQALRAGVTGEQAKMYLARGARVVNPDFWWMRVPTEWGIRVRPKDPAMGLQLSDLMVGTYGDVPDVWTNRSEIARGSWPNPIVEDMGDTIFEKAIVWADCVVPLYEIAIRDRWAAATDLPWNTLEPLPTDIERAVCQFLTEQSERAYFEATMWAGWLPEISYGFLELKLFLSTVIFDLARHSEAFRKRALANGGGLGLQAPTDYNRIVKEARTFPELAAVLFVQDSMLLTLFRHGERFAQNQLERQLYALCARDRERLVEYQVERLKHFLYKMPDRREEQNLYFSKAEGRIAKEWRAPAVWEPLAVMLGGGADRIAEGRRMLQELRKAQVDEYLATLRRATFERKNLNGRLLAVIEEATAPTAAG